MDCIFCKIIVGELPCCKIGENEDFICFLSIQPVNPGHALVVPKRHCKDILDFPQELDESYFAFVQEMVKKIMPAVGADGYNVGMNNGAASGQVIFHQHTHLIPRKDDDGLESWPHKEATPEELQAVQQKILGNV